MSNPSASSLLDFLRRARPSTVSDATTEADLPHLSPNLFPETHYTDSEKVETGQWLTTSARLATPDEDEAKHAERLGSLNIHLSTRTTLLGTKPSIADIALFFRLAPAVKTWTPEERTGEHGYHNIMRLIDFVQNAPLFGLALAPEDKVHVNVDDVRYVHKPIDAKEEKERKKKERAAASAPVTDSSGSQSLPVRTDKDLPPAPSSNVGDSTQPASNKPSTPNAGPAERKEKKDKKPKPPAATPPAAQPPSLSPCLIDLRVGHILQAIPHPNADSLYVSTVACGDPPSAPNTSLHEPTGQTVRTVCSGLNGLIPLADLQNRKIVAVCNLKPVTMRGVKSAAMVLAASPRPSSSTTAEDSGHKGPVELVNPPETAEAGERVYFEGWQGEPEAVLNPKKKIWETLQPGFTTTAELEVAFESQKIGGLEGKGQGGAARLRTKEGLCSVASLKGAVVR